MQIENNFENAIWQLLLNKGLLVTGGSLISSDKSRMFLLLR